MLSAFLRHPFSLYTGQCDTISQGVNEFWHRAKGTLVEVHAPLTPVESIVHVTVDPSSGPIPLMKESISQNAGSVGWYSSIYRWGQGHHEWDTVLTAK